MSASQKKIILITGANKGVGYETAKNLVLSSLTYHVLVGSRDPAKGEQAVAQLRAEKDIQGTAEAIQIDVTLDETVEAAAQQVGAKFGRLDGLVNNAGVSSKSASSVTQLRENLAVNTVGPVLVTEAFLPLLKKSADPRLVFVTTSLASLHHATDPSSLYYSTKAPYPYDYYRASKVALNMIMVEFNKREGRQIKVWGGDPGWLATDLADKALMEKLGAPHASVGGNEIARCIKGDRDADVGKVVGKYGIQKW
ncbi:hypothetical protein DV738_g1478, partial [Chaetothyriales sp. CBS 135597]